MCTNGAESGFMPKANQKPVSFGNFWVLRWVPLKNEHGAFSEAMRKNITFLENISLALRLIHAKYPAAQLYEVQCATADGDPTSDPARLTKLEVVCCNINNSTVTISSKQTIGEWNEPQFIASPWFQDVVISWPIVTDMVAAHKFLVEAGYTNPFTVVTLREPLGPVITEPYYIFNVGGEFISVGVKTHKVEPINN